MNKLKDRLRISKIDLLIIIVLLAVFVGIGIAISTSVTKKQTIKNFKSDTEYLVNIAKNSYKYFEKNNSNYIINSSDGTTKGMCITINGLKKNDFLIQDYKDWEGYFVIEETANSKYIYSVWLTNHKYAIEGYEVSEIEKLSLKNGLENYNNHSFSTKVNDNFTGTTSTKGGTGGTNESSVKKYEGKCIDEKIE